MTFYIPDPGACRFEWMTDTIRTSGLPRTVEELTIVIEFQEDIEDSGGALTEVGDELSSADVNSVLAAACLGHEGSMLKKVQLKLLTGSVYDVDNEYFKEDLPVWLPSLHEAGLLEGSTGLIEDKWKVLTSLSIVARS